MKKLLASLLLLLATIPSSAGGDKEGNGGSSIAQDFAALGYQVVEILRFWEANPFVGVSPELIQTAVDKTFIKTSKHVFITAPDGSRLEVDARNYVDLDSGRRVIEASEARLGEMKNDIISQLALAFHEYLGIANKESNHYETSAKFKRRLLDQGVPITRSQGFARVSHIFLDKCLKCHGRDSESGVDFRDVTSMRNQVMNFDHPEDSLLYQKISQGKMPKGDKAEKLSQAETLDVLRWIRAGAPTLGFQKNRMTETDLSKIPGLNDENSEIAVLRAVIADFQTLPIREWQHYRYLSMAHLAKAGADKKDLTIYRQALNKLVNSLSWQPKLASLKVVNAEGTLLRLDLRDYGWQIGLWSGLALKYPYGIRLQGNDAKIYEKLPATGFDGAPPIVHADWFAFQVTQPRFYHAFLGIPEREQDLQERIGVSSRNSFLEARLLRGGFDDSGVSLNNRVIERLVSPYGAFWRSYDFTTSQGNGDIFNRPLAKGESQGLGFAHDGGEIIFNLPNGLQGYMIVDHLGRRLDQAPTTIVRDFNRRDLRVTTGISCMECHSQGMRTREDKIQASVIRHEEDFDAEDTQLIKKLYSPSNLAKSLEEDSNRFKKSLEDLEVAETYVHETISTLVKAHEAELGYVQAASELGVHPLILKNKISAVSRFSTLESRLSEEKLPRDVFEESFQSLAKELNKE